MTYNGKCHCGKIAFDVEGDLTEIIECNCSICYESGYLHWMIDPSQLRIKTPLKDASLYLWGTGQARHYFCPKCGVAVLRNPRTSPDTKFSVNVRCLAEVDVSKLKVTQFDGRNKLKVQGKIVAAQNSNRDVVMMPPPGRRSPIAAGRFADSSPDLPP